MADATKLMPFILKWEGGFSNKSADKGGATNKGVTLTTFRQYYGASATVTDLKNITDAQWLYIFRTGYWNPFRGDFINSQSVANACVDWAWHSGLKTAAKQVQKLLDVTVDGFIGQKSVAAINAADSKQLFDKIIAARLVYVKNIVAKDSTQKTFLKGWTNRINSLKYSD